MGLVLQCGDRYGCPAHQETCMKPRDFAIAFAAVALTLALPARAAPEWNFTPYIWAAGFDGTIGAAGGDAGIGDRPRVDFSNSLSDNLRLGGFMLNASWRNDRLTAFGDWTYAKVKSDTDTPFGLLHSSVNGEIKGNIV
ncbi:MAG: hypothetical protein ABI585_12740 [Betaproteobacteria bacterium]